MDVKTEMTGSWVLVVVGWADSAGLPSHILKASVSAFCTMTFWTSYDESCAALGQRNRYLILLTWGMVRCQGC